MPETPSITVKIDNKKPVELVDFTKSLLALGDEFHRRVAGRAEGFEGRLYVKELRKGSLVAELTVIASSAAAVAEAAMLTTGFVDHLKATIAWVRGRGEKPLNTDAKTISNISTLIEPVAKDNGSNIVINLQGNNNVINLNAAEAAEAQRKIARIQAAEREPKTEIYEKALMYWAIVKNEKGLPSTGEKAMIDKLSDKPVKVVFDSRDLREEMLQGQANPLKEVFVVDVETQTVRGRLASYKVLQMHERFRIDED